MGILRAPKTIRWILCSGILLLVLLTAYRYVVYLLFQNLFGGIKNGLALAFWYGLRFDGRIICIFTLLMFLLSFYPGKHFFKSEEGRKVALWVSGIFITVIILFYVADIGYLRNFNTRLNGSLISDLAKNTEKGLVYKSKTEWLVIVPAMFVTNTLYLVAVYKIHTVIRNKKGTTNFGKRLTWQIGLVLLSLLGIYASFSTRPLTVTSAKHVLSPAQLTLALNPLESILNTMPGKVSGQ